MGDWILRCWVVGVFLVAAGHCAEESESHDFFCMLDEPAEDKRSPAVCPPPQLCDAGAVLQHYTDIRKECLTSDSQRRDRTASFLSQLNYWHGELRFFFDLLVQSHNETSDLVVELERKIREDDRGLEDLERKYFFHSIAAGHTKDALFVYLVMPNQLSPTEIINTINATTTFNEAVLLNILFFVRTVPGKARRLEFYKAIKPMLSQHNNVKSYVVLLYSAEVFPVVHKTTDFKEYYTDVITPFVNRLKDRVFKSNYVEFLWVENRFPSYFAHAIPLLTQFSNTEWMTKVNYLPLFENVNSFQSLPNRFTMFERIIDNIVQHDIKDRRKDRSATLLPSLAYRVSQLEKALEAAGKDPQLMKRLQALKKSFQMHKNNPKLNYDHYLRHFTNHGKIKSRT